MRKILCFTLFFTCIGCTTHSDNADVYDSAEIGQISRSQKGVIVNKRTVKITDKSGRSSGTGALIGAGSGAVLGSMFGGSTEGHLLGATIGAVAGGATGHMIEKNQQSQGVTGYEYQVRIQGTDEVVSIIQEKNPELHVGQQVVIKISGRRSRIYPQY